MSLRIVSNDVILLHNICFINLNDGTEWTVGSGCKSHPYHRAYCVPSEYQSIPPVGKRGNTQFMGNPRDHILHALYIGIPPITIPEAPCIEIFKIFGKYAGNHQILILIPYTRSEEHTSELQSRGHLV